MYNFKLLKFYYNLSYNLLPSYFDCYLDVLNRDLPHQYELRQDARSIIRLPRTRLVFAESSLLYQLITLINYSHIHHPTIIEKVKNKTHSYEGYGFNIIYIWQPIITNALIVFAINADVSNKYI